LQPTLPEAHLALGYLYYRDGGDYERALRELAIAKVGLPNDPDIFLVTGSIERRQGKWAQSTADLEKAASVNPKNASLWTNLAINYQSVHNFPAAAKAFERGVEADRTFVNQCLRARLDIDWKGDTGSMERLLIENREHPDPEGRVTLARFQLKRFQRKYEEAIEVLSKSTFDSFSEWSVGLVFPRQILLADVYRRANEQAKARLCLEEARQVLENAVRESPLDASRHALLGQTYAGLGRTDDAIREGKRAVELLPESKDALDGPVMTLILAQIYTIVGDLDSAIPLLEHSIATPAGITVPLLKLDPNWDPLRSDPRFEKIITSFSLREGEL
jgi:tetratricopeptide (TPR) repeat protein